MNFATASSILALSLGVVGCQGEPGQIGATGNVGATGQQGLQGLSGEQGLTGEQGVDGLDGSTGEVGARGSQGLQGLQGITGEKSVDIVDVLTSIGAQSEAIVYVECLLEEGSVHGSGTKTVDGQVITAHHVVEDSEQCFILHGSPVELLGEVTAVAQLGERDQVTLEVDWNDEGLAIVGLEPKINARPGLGDFLVVAGHPSVLLERQFTVGSVTSTGLEATFAPAAPLPEGEGEGGEVDGTILAEEDPHPPHIYWTNAWATDAISAGGSSGGPVFNSAGEWIGLLVAGFTNVDLGVVIPVE